LIVKYIGYVNDINIPRDKLSMAKLNIFHFNKNSAHYPYASSSGTGIVFTNIDSKDFGFMLLVADNERIYCRKLSDSNYGTWQYLNYTSS
jgi:hypothetical protein